MKKLFLLVLLISSCFYFSNAQEFKIEASKNYEKNNLNEVTKVVFATPYGFSTYSYLDNVFLDNEKEITLTKYDQQLNAISTKRFKLPKLNLRAADLNKVIELKNSLIFISNSMSKKQGIREVYAQVYNVESETVSDSKIIASYPIESYSKSGQIEVNISENKTKIVVFANLPFVKKTKEKIKTWVFDSSLNNLYTSENTLSLNSERAHSQDVHINNDGIVYIIKRHKYNSKKATSSSIIINDSSISETLISEPSFFLRQTILVNIGTKNLIAGFYFEGKVPYVDNRSSEGNETHGVFLYDPESKKLLGKHKFSSKEGNIKKLKSLVPIYTNVIGDNIYLIGEKQTYSSKFKSEKSTELDYLYTHGPTIIINLNTEGTLKTMRILNNVNTYKNENNVKASIAVKTINGGLKLFFNKNNFTIFNYFDDNQVSHQGLRAKYNETSEVTTYLNPKSLKMVDNYNIIYFVSSSGKNFWLHKMTW